MLTGCLAPTAWRVFAAEPHDRRWLPLMAHLASLCLAMPTACLAGWIVGRVLPGHWAGAPAVALWTGVMLVVCAAVVHGTVRCGAAIAHRAIFPSRYLSHTAGVSHAE